MAIYWSSIEMRSWKEHTCVACNGRYRYVLHRRVSAHAPERVEAHFRAQKKAEKAMQVEVDIHPCPNCGMVQLDMIGQERAKWHRRIGYFALVLFTFLLIARTGKTLHQNYLTWGAFVVGAIVVAAHCYFDPRNFQCRLAAEPADRHGTCRGGHRCTHARPNKSTEPRAVRA